MKHTIFFMALLVASYLTCSGQENYLEKGNAFLNNGKFEKAEKVFREAMKADSSNIVYQCQLGLALIEQKKFTEANSVLEKVLQKDSNHLGATWYGGVGHFKNGQDRKAISFFEKALTLLNSSSGQYYAANWFIGKSYSILLKTEGLTYEETDRMFACYEEYLRLQPNATNAAEIREYVERKKKRRPGTNVLKWVDL